MTSQKNTRTFKTVAATMVALTALTGAVAHANAKPFSFGSVEFMPRDQREAAAQAFVANDLTAGMPIASALQVLKKADVYCRVPSVPGRAISCTHASFEQHPDDTGPVDVIWTVRVTPSADGTIGAATVSRSRYGF